MAWRPDYVTLEQQKAYQRLTTTTDDAVIPGWITTASRAVDDATGRQFGSVDEATTRVYTAEPDYERGVWVVVVDDIHDSADLEITVDGTALTADQYVLEPVNAVADGRVYERVRIKRDSSVQPTGADDEIEVTTPNFGWAAVPTGVAEAVKLQTSRFGMRRDAPHGIAGSPDAGSELRFLSTLDADVRVMIRGFVRPRRPL
jgi:hypothetical protein